MTINTICQYPVVWRLTGIANSTNQKCLSEVQDENIVKYICERSQLKDAVKLGTILAKIMWTRNLSLEI